MQNTNYLLSSWIHKTLQNEEDLTGGDKRIQSEGRLWAWPTEHSFISCRIQYQGDVWTSSPSRIEVRSPKLGMGPTPTQRYI